MYFFNTTLTIFFQNQYQPDKSSIGQTLMSVSVASACHNVNMCATSELHLPVQSLLLGAAPLSTVATTTSLLHYHNVPVLNVRKVQRQAPLNEVRQLPTVMATISEANQTYSSAL